MKKFLLFGLILIVSCQEIYKPKLDESQSLLVVEGQITDETGPQLVKLSYAIPFNSEILEPVRSAGVFAIDSNGHTYAFTESTQIPGSYYSDPNDLKPEYGQKYSLHIYLKNGKQYSSTAETLLPKGNLDQVTGIAKSESKLVGSTNASLISIPGIEFVAETNATDQSEPYYRFASKLLITYSTTDTSKYTSYCWMTFNANDFFALLNEKNTVGKTQRVVGFCPKDSGFYNLITEQVTDKSSGSRSTFYIYKTIHQFTLTIKQYHINEEIYQYYNSLNGQLEAKQKIFDPITIQSIGNITCVTNPDERVLGLFEVSSVVLRTFTFDPYASDNGVVLQEVPALDMESLPGATCQKNIVPPFWTIGK